MERMVNSTLLALELGEPQGFENLAVFPVRFPQNGGPEYITLKEALARGVFAVSEVSAGGAVSELLVENRGDVAVLLLDGEELAGAKQNRVLNTTIFVAPKTSIKVPVSCTEHGRWSSVSKVMGESGNIMATSLRKSHMAGVNINLEASREFRSNQAQVWNDIAMLHRDLGVMSETGAMKAVYDAKKADLDAYLKHFPAVDHQQGMLVFINGKAVGLDYVSRASAYAILHGKLLKSYAMEAVRVAGREGHLKKERHGIFGLGKKAAGDERREAGAQAKWATPDEAAARDFLMSATECEEKAYESVGEGWSYRYTGRVVVGSALAVEGTVVHAAFFRTGGSESEHTAAMADFSTRRRFRT